MKLLCLTDHYLIIHFSLPGVLSEIYDNSTRAVFLKGVPYFAIKNYLTREYNDHLILGKLITPFVKLVFWLRFLSPLDDVLKRCLH